MAVLVRKDLLYPELSYKLVGVLFEVSNKLGHKYEERYFQKATASFLSDAKIQFKEQVAVKLTIGNKEIAKGIIDFLIEDTVILEIKRGDRFLKGNIDQVNSYLQITGLQLGILANFTSRGLQFKRILNIQNS
jgi:GxxExxY protein